MRLPRRSRQLRRGDVAAAAADEDQPVLEIGLREQQRPLPRGVLPRRGAALERPLEQRRRELRGADDGRGRGEADPAERRFDQVEREARLSGSVGERRPRRGHQPQLRRLRGGGNGQRGGDEQGQARGQQTPPRTWWRCAKNMDRLDFQRFGGSGRSLTGLYSAERSRAWTRLKSDEALEGPRRKPFF